MNSLDTVITFGKYKLKRFTLFDLIDHDIDYVAWLVENANLIMDNEAFDYYQKKREE